MFPQLEIFLGFLKILSAFRHDKGSTGPDISGQVAGLPVAECPE
jgi:hypothetical protein